MRHASFFPHALTSYFYCPHILFGRTPAGVSDPSDTVFWRCQPTERCLQSFKSSVRLGGTGCCPPINPPLRIFLLNQPLFCTAPSNVAWVRSLEPWKIFSVDHVFFKLSSFTPLMSTILTAFFQMSLSTYLVIVFPICPCCSLFWPLLYLGDTLYSSLGSLV